MAIEIEYPDISSSSLVGKVNQIHSYLFQMAEQLKWALGMLEDLEREDRRNIEEGRAELEQQIAGAVAPLKDAVDFVIETGSEDIWSWRKWSSGRLDLWGKTSESIACTTAFGSLFYSPLKEFNLPDGLVSSINAMHIDVSGSGAMFAAPYSSTGSVVRFYVYSGTSETKSETIYFIINANWR